MTTHRNYLEEWKIAADRWADLDSAARLLEETKSAVMSKWMLELGEVPVSKAEKDVKASDRWFEYVERVVKARTAAEKAKIEMRYADMKLWEQRSYEATARTEARL